MDKHFICLANSYKRGGRCIAGIIVTIKPNGQWVKETTQNGSPKWIRPIDKNTEYVFIATAKAYGSRPYCTAGETVRDRILQTVGLQITAICRGC